MTTVASHLSALRELLVGVEMDAAYDPSGPAKIAALQAAITALASPAGEGASSVAQGGRLRRGDVYAIACVLAREDGYDPEDMHGGLYDVRWSGGSSPEPEGDAWNMDYLPKAERIVEALGGATPPPAPAAGPVNTGIDFGSYVRIEQKRYGVPNQMFSYKVIGRLRSNVWVDAPVQSPAAETFHSEMADVVACICCGVNEREVLRFRVSDVCATQPEARGVEGMVLVPREPTPEMLAAVRGWTETALVAEDATCEYPASEDTLAEAYRAMLAAAPAAPGAAVGVDDGMIARAESYMVNVLPGKSTACLGGSFNFYDLLTTALAGKDGAQ